MTMQDSIPTLTTLDSLTAKLKQSNVDYNNSVNYQEQTKLAIYQRELIAALYSELTINYKL